MELEKSTPPCYEECFENVPYPEIPDKESLLSDVTGHWAHEDSHILRCFKKMQQNAQKTLDQKIAKLNEEYKREVLHLELLKNEAKRKIANERARKIRRLMESDSEIDDDEIYYSWNPFEGFFT
jgi:hypothetical protein